MASRNLQTLEPRVVYGALGLLVLLLALGVYVRNRADKRRALAGFYMLEIGNLPD